MKHYNQRWSQDDSEMMGQLLAEGQSHKQIAIALDRTPWAVSSRIQWLSYKGGLSKPARTEINKIIKWLDAMKRDDTNWPQVIARMIENGAYRK